MAYRRSRNDALRRLGYYPWWRVGLARGSRTSRRVKAMLLATFVVAVLASEAPGSSVVISDSDLQSAIQQHRGATPELFADEPWRAIQLPEPLSVLRGTPSDASVAEVISKFQSTYHLAPPAARDFLAYEVLTRNPKAPWKAGPHQALGIEAGFAAARQAPREIVPLLGLVAHRWISEDPRFRRRVLEALDSSADPAKLALQLLLPASRGTSRWSPILAAYVVGRLPSSLPEAIRGVGDEADSRLLAFRLAAHRVAPAGSVTAPLLRDLLEAGFDDVALAVLASTPPSVQRELLEARASAVPALEKAHDLARVDLRTLIAAAVLGQGGRTPAELWLKSAREVTRCGEVARQMLSTAMQLENPDRFQLLSGDRSCGPMTTPSWLNVQQAVLGRDYPEHVTGVAVSARSRFEGSPEGEPVLSELPFTRQAALDLEAERGRARAKVDAWIAARPPPAKDPDAAGDSVARRMLTMPPQILFTERSLRDVKSQRRNAWKPVSDVRLPPGFRVIRAERDGSTVVAVALSHRLDPTGEVSGGGYWVLVSGNGGTSWGEPLYTGLRALRPYVLAERSVVSILNGDEIRLAAARQELVEESITFPPVGLRTGPRQGGLVLLSTLATLRRDSDGDGLTDVVEERLMLDPSNPDSDGDGIPDGRDPAPHIPNRQESTRDGELLSELLARLIDRQWRHPGSNQAFPILPAAWARRGLQSRRWTSSSSSPPAPSPPSGDSRSRSWSSPQTKWLWQPNGSDRSFHCGSRCSSTPGTRTPTSNGTKAGGAEP